MAAWVSSIDTGADRAVPLKSTSRPIASRHRAAWRCAASTRDRRHPGRPRSPGVPPGMPPPGSATVPAPAAGSTRGPRRARQSVAACHQPPHPVFWSGPGRAERVVSGAEPLVADGATARSGLSLNSPSTPSRRTAAARLAGRRPPAGRSGWPDRPGGSPRAGRHSRGGTSRGGRAARPGGRRRRARSAPRTGCSRCEAESDACSAQSPGRGRRARPGPTGWRGRRRCAGRRRRPGRTAGRGRPAAEPADVGHPPEPPQVADLERLDERGNVRAAVAVGVQCPDERFLERQADRAEVAGVLGLR
jgi:hypothetical protein